MTDKYELLKAIGSHVQEGASAALGLEADVCNELYRALMRAEEVRLWDLATYWEQECLKCMEAKAHFSAMISAVAMNESLLCYLCVINEEQVRNSPSFKKVVGRRNVPSFSKLVGDWKLKTLLLFAFDLDWIPANLIDSKKADLLLAVLVEVRDDPLPSDFTLATENLENLLIDEPGRGMLEMTQNLRNYVHPTRWLRLQKQTGTKELQHMVRDSY